MFFKNDGQVFLFIYADNEREWNYFLWYTQDRRLKVNLVWPIKSKISSFKTEISKPQLLFLLHVSVTNNLNALIYLTIFFLMRSYTLSTN